MNIVVTGGAQGIGRGIVEHLLEHGHAVAQFDISADDDEPDISGGAFGRYRCDVSDPDEVDAAFEKARHDLGVIDGLVNNAGVYPRAALIDMPHDRWMQVLGVNLAGPATCARALVRQLPARTPAAIVNISSSIAFEGAPAGSHYAASKAGILGLTRALAVELAPLIRVNVIVPGIVDTAQVRQGGRGEQELAEYAAQEVPLLRLGTGEDIARAARFLLGPDAAYITGQTLGVNGGSLLV